jgi:hypothetical protein
LDWVGVAHHRGRPRPLRRRWPRCWPGAAETPRGPPDGATASLRGSSPRTGPARGNPTLARAHCRSRCSPRRAKSRCRRIDPLAESKRPGDPHLRATKLFDDVVALGYAGSYPSFTRRLLEPFARSSHAPAAIPPYRWATTTERLKRSVTILALSRKRRGAGRSAHQSRRGHVIASAIAMWPSKPHAVALAR